MSPPPAAAERAAPALEERAGFVAEARAFAARRRGDPAFRLLRALLQASEEDLDLLAAKAWCDAHPLNYGRKEPLLLSCAKSLLMPFHWLASRRLALGPASEPADFDVETVDLGYFERWQRPFYERLPGRRRLTPSAGPRPARPEGAEAVLGLISPRGLAAAFLSWLALPFLIRLSLLHGRNLAAPYRAALGLYFSFEAHFRRYPCRVYLAYADDHNHPARQLAARRAGARLAVLQNGERTVHPVYAFGAMDLYLSFGEHMRRLAPALGMRVGRVVPVGALYLNGRLGELGDLAGLPKDIDLLFIDQLVWPYNDFDPATGRAFERCFSWLGELKAARPDLSVAFQLRAYADPARREAVLARARPLLGPGVAILPNEGRGETYRNAARSRVVVTFQSTFGFEAFFAGKGTAALFANPTPNPYEIYCDDPRFQLHAPDGDFGAFRRKVEDLLALRLDGPPPAARERHAYTDGKVHERIARALAEEAAQ